MRGCAGKRIALEVDGPSHFAANTLAPGGAMLARHRLLAARGWAVISVPYYVWERLSEAGRNAWLMQARTPVPDTSRLPSVLMQARSAQMRAVHINLLHF